MTKIAATVYDPPTPELPYLSVLFDENGEVLAARSMPSFSQAEIFTQSLMNEFQAKIDKDLGKL